MEQQKVIEKFQEFVAVEGDTLLRLLSRAEQVVARGILARLEEMGYTHVSVAELRLMQQLCLAGIRIAELAERMKISKQAVSQLIDSLENKQFVTRSPDPDDKRAKIITYTTRGYQFISDAIDATLLIEKKIANLTGPENYQSLKRSLLALNHGFAKDL